MTANGTLNHTRTKSPATNFIKYLLVITSLVLAAPVLADDKQAFIDECYSKHAANDYNSAFTGCKQLAEQGNAGAQSLLGLMFSNGKGTPKDNVMAYIWWNVAAAQGDEDAKKNRGTVEKNRCGA
jgi:O-glycosyl hydrolase